MPGEKVNNFALVDDLTLVHGNNNLEEGIVEFQQ